MRTAISLFCGGGIADIGLIDAGFDIVLAVEREEWIAQTYSQNFNHRVICDRVGNVDFTSYQGVDLVFLSPPCQGDSLMRSRHLPPHPDRDVLGEAMNAILTIQPLCIVLENVPGFRNNLTYQSFGKTLYQHGYWFQNYLINCADFGVPQNRKRLMAIAFKNKLIPFNFPKLKTHLGWFDFVKDLIPNLPVTELAKWQVEKLVQNAPKSPFLLPRVGHRGKELNHIPSYIPAPTLRALGHDRHWRQFDVYDGKVFRKFLPRCEARIMTVPDWFKLPSTNWQAKRIIGNGFPSLAMQQIAKLLIDNIN
jgi:DNA (cytosine-5)-methyltransferase 1